MVALALASLHKHRARKPNVKYTITYVHLIHLRGNSQSLGMIHVGLHYDLNLFGWLTSRKKQVVGGATLAEIIINSSVSIDFHVFKVVGGSVAPIYAYVYVTPLRAIVTFLNPRNKYINISCLHLRNSPETLLLC